MKKITFLIAFIAIGFMANAEVYLTENFDYTAASLLKTNTGWGINSGTLNAWDTEFYIGASSLTYSDGINSFVNSGLGKSVVCEYTSAYTTNSSNYCVSKNFVATALTTGTVYASFLYSPNSVTQAQSQIPVISLGTSTSNTGVQVWVGKVATDGTTFRIGVTRGSTSSSNIVWGSTAFTDINATYLIVLKYDIGATSASIFVNPTLSSTIEGTAIATDAASSSPKTSLQLVQFKTNGASKEYFKVSGLRISSTWTEAVAALTMLSAPTASDATLITSAGFTANWTTVANASSYDVKVYDATLSLISTTNASGQTASSLAIAGLGQNTTYTYTVTAKGNNITYSDSPASSAITVTTTVTSGLNSSKSAIYISVSAKNIIASEAGNMEVYNLQGAQVLRAENVKSINTNLGSGMYIVNFVNKSGVKTIQKISIR